MVFITAKKTPLMAGVFSNGSYAMNKELLHMSRTPPALPVTFDSSRGRGNDEGRGCGHASGVAFEVNYHFPAHGGPPCHVQYVRIQISVHHAQGRAKPPPPAVGALPFNTSENARSRADEDCGGQEKKQTPQSYSLGLAVFPKFSS